ncbi:MAG: ABC transporter ATP-binding protein [Lachnospiraceae bacterium]|nr:ABC transporter ATP-binding protein [Lachnospiraceae bacterium]MBQ4069172.1 ABC transporter ATP-binding protein [Lachnospiraceae bacterium]
MKSLLVYLKEYKKESILGPLFKLLEATFELIIPLIMADIINVGIEGGNRTYIIQRCLIMVALGVIGLICSITAQYFSAKAAVGFATKLRHSLFTHIQELSYTEIDSIGTSTLITRMTSDINQLQSGVNLVLRLFLRSPFIVFGAMIMAFTIDVKAALIFVVTIPALSIVVFGIMMITIPMYKKVQTGLDKVLGITRENLSGTRVIRAFDKEESEIDNFEAATSALSLIQMKVGKVSGLMNPLTYVIVNVATVALIWTGAIKVELGILDTGLVVALLNYMSQILVELIKLANLIVTVTKALACASRIEGIFNIKSSMKFENDAPQEVSTDDVVRFENVSLKYAGGGEPAISNVNFTVKKGQTIGIIGGTGSGKTSLVNLIPRFYDATEGTVYINGVDIKKYPREMLRDKIGVVMQKAVLFKGTIEENLKWGKNDASEEDLDKALSISQSKEFVDKKDGKLSSYVSQGGKNLSGGQRQRLTIARAVIKEPDILILDDSASALDFATDASLRKAIREMKDDITTFIVSQRAASIQYADQIIVLDDGEVVGIGRHDDLLVDCEVYQEIYYSQFKKSEE